MTMSADDLKEARRFLGLSVADFAAMLGVGPQHVRRMETGPGRGAHRRVTDTTERLVRAYLSGYRPKDWPSGARAPAESGAGSVSSGTGQSGGRYPER